MPMMAARGHERPAFMHPTGGPPGLVHPHLPNAGGVVYQHIPAVSHIPPQMPMHEHFNRPV